MTQAHTSTEQPEALRDLAEAVKELTTTEAWPHDDEDYSDVAFFGHVSDDGEKYPVAEVNADTYGYDGESLKLAKFYAAASPAVVLGLLDRIAELEASQAQRVPMTERADFCAIIKNHLQQYSSTRLCCHNSVPALAKSEFDEVAAEIASDLLQAARRAPAVPVPQGWHAPGLGEVHNAAHDKMIYCADAEGVACNKLAQEVLAALAAAPQPPEAAPVEFPEPDAWRYTDARGHFRYRGARPGFAVEYPILKPDALYTEQQVRKLLAAQHKPVTDEAVQPCCNGGPQWGHAWGCPSLP